jgi:hypothetical protein
MFLKSCKLTWLRDIYILCHVPRISYDEAGFRNIDGGTFGLYEMDVKEK